MFLRNTFMQFSGNCRCLVTVCWTSHSTDCAYVWHTTTLTCIALFCFTLVDLHHAMTCVLDCIFLPFCLDFVLVRKVLSDLQKHFIFCCAHGVNDSPRQQLSLAPSQKLLFFCLRCPSLSTSSSCSSPSLFWMYALEKKSQLLLICMQSALVPAVNRGLKWKWEGEKEQIMLLKRMHCLLAGPPAE